MKIAVTLTTSAGTLASEEIDIAEHKGDVDEAINLAAHEAIAGFILSDGDTITIKQV